MLLFPRPSFPSRFAAYGAPAWIAQGHVVDPGESPLNDFFMSFAGVRSGTLMKKWSSSDRCFCTGQNLTRHDLQKRSVIATTPEDRVASVASLSDPPVLADSAFDASWPTLPANPPLQRPLDAPSVIQHRREPLLESLSGDAPPVLNPVASPSAPAVGDFLLIHTLWRFHHDLNALARPWSVLAPSTQDRWDQTQRGTGQRQEPPLAGGAHR